MKKRPEETNVVQNIAENTMKRPYEQRERFKENRDKDTFTHNRKDAVEISKAHHKGMK